MPARAFLAFDLGAESGRALLGRLEGERLTVREISRFPNGMLSLHGRLHWNVFRLFEHIKDALRTVAREGAAADSVGLDTWGVDFALLARDGGVLGLPFAYRDPHTAGAMDSFFRKVPREEVYARTGIQFLPLNSLFQLEAMARDRSPLLEAAADLLFIPDLFHYFLSGVKKTEFTFATTSQLYNPSTRDWDGRLLDALGLPRSLFQQLVEPGTIIGLLSKEIGAETGFAPVPLVAVATHDTASAVAAIPAEGDDWAYISSGTWSLMGIESRAPIITDEARRANFTNEGGVGATFRVLKNITGLWLLQQCRRAWSVEREISYDELTKAASEAPPFASFVDPDDPGFLNPPDMPAAVRAFCRRTGQPEPESIGATVRCVLESLALKYRFVLEQIRRLRAEPIQRIHVIGGGAKNTLLCQFTADATGAPVHAGPVEATAIGNLLVQAMALGQIGSLPELREIVRASFPPQVYEPRETKSWEAAAQRIHR
jgi:rhamnulokinase